MVCCNVDRVNYVVPNPCTAAEIVSEVPAPQLAFTLESNTSGFQINAVPYTGAVPVGSALPALSNGVIGTEVAFMVLCGGGIPSFPNTISITATIAAHDRRMLGIGFWDHYGSIHTDGDGIDYDSIEVYDGATLLHTQVGLNTANNGAFHETLFPAPVANADNIRMWAGNKPAGGSIHANTREIAPVWDWQGRIDWPCSANIFAIVRPVDPTLGPLRQISSGDRLTMTRGGIVIAGAGGTLAQNFGPHTMTFEVPPGVVGTITTNRPQDFSSLTVTQADNVITLSGNTTRTFDISWDFAAGGGCRPGYVRNGVVYDMANGFEIVDPQLCNG